ncbi:MAG: MBL fold metallo-hydrolase [Candidatus Hodarchaeota archaeon]
MANGPYINVTENVVAAAVAFTNKEIDKVPPPHKTGICTCIALPDELVFIDCGLFLDFASQFRHDMEKRFNRPTSHLLFTHLHWDHFFALEAFEDVQIVASKAETARVRPQLRGRFSKEKRKQNWKYMLPDDKEAAKAYVNAKLFLPNIQVEDSLKIGPKNDEIVYQVVGGHTRGSASICVPKERTLCVGDNAYRHYYPLMFELGEPVLETYRYWETLPVDHVIPGHCEIITKAYLAKLRLYFEKLIAALQKLREKQTAINKVVKHPSIPHFFGKDEPAWEEGGKYHTKWEHHVIKMYYRKICGRQAK